MATIYAGRAPIKRLGHRQFSMLEFALRYPGWHSLGVERHALPTVRSLAARHLVEFNTGTRQFRFADTRA